MIHSFAIHEPQCRELFEKREALKPAKERRKCPADPVAHMEATKGNIDEINDISNQAWSDNLAKCQFCGRSFLPEKLLIHNKSCTASKPSRSVNSAQRVSSSSSSSFAATASGTYGDAAHSASTPKRSSGNVSDDYATPAGFVPASFIQCPTCGRSFNEIAYAK